MIDFNFSWKIIKPLGVIVTILTLAYGFFNLMVEKKVFSQLSEKHTYLLICLIIILTFLYTIWFSFKYFQTLEEKKGKKVIQSKEQTTKHYWLIYLLITIILSFCIFHIDKYTNSSKVILSENFSINNSPKVWSEINTKTTKSVFNNGYYYLLSKSKFPEKRRIDVNRCCQFNLSDSSNFEINLRIKNVVKNTGYGLQFLGNSKESVFYSFYINDKQQFSIQIFRGNISIRTVVDWEISKQIKLNDFNILSVKAKGNVIQCLINGKIVHDNLLFSPIGNEVGFGTNPNTSIIVDYLNILFEE